MSSNGVNKVGYKSPPKESQFKPGRSGNPSGRPKHVFSWKRELIDELSQVVQITDNDGRVSFVSRGRALIKVWLGAATNGDYRAFALLSSFCELVYRHQHKDNDNGPSTAAEFIDLLQAAADRKTKDLIGSAATRELPINPNR